MLFRRFQLSVATAVLGFCAPGLPAVAAAGDGEATTGWDFRFTSYSWASWLTGEGGVAGRSFDVELDPVELIDHLDWDQLPVWMSYAEVRNGRFSFFNDIVYSKLEGSGDFAVSRTRRFSGLTLAGDVEADVEQATVEFGAAYAAGQWGLPNSAGTTAFDVLAGVRYWHQEVDLSVDLTGALNIAGLTIEGIKAIARSGSIDWVDPFVGARLRHQLGPGEEILLRGDVGGFGIGSDISWQLIGTYNWEMCKSFGLVIDGYVGYRALAVDYEQGSGLRKYEYDVLQHGPVVGITTRF
jgi:hypothetical protein